MAKAPRPGTVKTRLSPPLTPHQAAAINTCFLQDTAESLADLIGLNRDESRAAGVISYTPVGDEALFDGLLPTGFSLIPQRGSSFGERLLLTAQDILACGYGSVCLIDSDSPTVPAAAFQQAIDALSAPGDRKVSVVLGPSNDGGYYLIGPHSRSPRTFCRYLVEHLHRSGRDSRPLPRRRSLAHRTASLVRRRRCRVTRPACNRTPRCHAAALRLYSRLSGSPHPRLSPRTSPAGGRFFMRYAARPWHTNLALLLFGIGLILLSRQLVVEYHHYTLGYSGVSGFSALLYIASILLVLTQPVDRLTLPLILGVAITCRVAPLFAEPRLSSDIYRYVWDGIVQHAHISPYRYVPGDPALAFLREQHQAIFDHINRRNYAHTIYPPIAQVLFYLITAVSPTILAMKTALVLCEVVTVAALIRILQQLDLRREQILLYAWCPLLVWEIAGSGHLDSVAMACISLALLFRLRRRPILTGLLLGIAVMTKFYPIVLLPALMIPRRPLPNGKKWAFLNPSLWDWKLPAATFAVVALGYAAYSSVGLLVFGFLSGYAHEEGMTTGTRYFLLDLAQHVPGLENLPTAVFYGVCLLIFAAIKLRALRSAAEKGVEADFLAPAFAFAIALMLLFSPHYPWYIAWLIPFFTLLPSLPILAYLMAFFYLFTTQLADGTLAKMFILNKILYATVAIAVILQIALRNRTVPGLNFHQRSQ